jgi:LmbE family N-acetylglucosaminyl deacetylase
MNEMAAAMKRIIVVAPHADDETLGCGGTLLKHKNTGDEINWLIFTSLDEKSGLSKERIAGRRRAIEDVRKEYGFQEVVELPFPSVYVDTYPMGELVATISESFKKIRAEVVYLPYRGDIHSDHAVTFDAVAACTKWFRYPCVKRVLAYEIASETDTAINPDTNAFRANTFVDITPYLDRKIQIMNIYACEMGDFPFPRSEKALRALAAVRGMAAGFEAAEAFMLLRELC